MPVVFVGHGSPMNAIEDNRWSREFSTLGRELPRPRAILAISAHWYLDGTLLTANEQPRTIHDFGGFPQALYSVQYPAPGSPVLARQIRHLLGEHRADLSDDWGIDHGSWSVLRWMFPDADIPVIQLSIDRRMAPQGHFEIGQALTGLREEGVLILASGNIVHNLRDAFERRRRGSADTPEWARRFDQAVAQAIMDREWVRLCGLASDTEEGRLAHPTPDHWLPLIYAAGAGSATTPVRFSSVGFDWGSLSMRNIIFG